MPLASLEALTEGNLSKPRSKLGELLLRDIEWIRCPLQLPIHIALVGGFVHDSISGFVDSAGFLGLVGLGGLGASGSVGV